MAVDSTTEPTELYNRNKRNLAIFVGLFLLVLLGITEVSDQNSNYGFRLSKDALPTVLLFVCVYLLYQYWLAWSFQVEALRTRLRHDFLLTVGGSFLVFLYFGYLTLADVIPSIDVPLVFAALSMLAVSIVAATAAWLAARLRASRAETVTLRKHTLMSRLLEPGWWLNFNPKLPGKVKQISFKTDGSIGQGRNANESTWSWSEAENLLEIFRENGEIQENRFRYDPDLDQFHAIQPSAIFNIEGQYLYRPGREPTYE